MSRACWFCGGRGEHDRQDKVVPVALTQTRFHRAEWDACLACNGTGLFPSHALSSSPPPPVVVCRRSRERYQRLLAHRPPSICMESQEEYGGGPGPLVLVAGCGIAGAAVCLALQHRGIRTVCFERDTFLEQRPQGYGLTLQQGLSALKALGIGYEDLAGCSRASVHHSFTHDGHLLGSYGHGLYSHQKDDDKRAIRTKRNLQLPRQLLRTALVERLAAAANTSTIRWGQSVTSFTDLDQGVRAHLSDGSHVDGALLVGCDGIRSAIRKQKLAGQAPLRYLGVMVILGICVVVPNNESTNVHQTSDGTTRIYSMPFDAIKGSVMWQLSFPTTEADARELAAAGPAALLAEAQRRCAQWHAPLPELIAMTPASSVSGYPTFDRDLPTPEQLRSGSGGNGDGRGAHVTLLGDALHPLSPFKAQGANQALLDAVACARAIADSTLGAHLPHSANLFIPATLARLEADVLQRVASKVRDSRENASLLHSPAVLAPGNEPRATVARQFG